MRYASRSSACRRGLNSHEAAEPREVRRSLLRATPPASSECELTEQRSRVMSRAVTSGNYMVPPCQIEPSRCEGCPAVQSVRGAAAASTAAFGVGQLPRRIEYVPCHGRQRGAGSDWCVPPGVTGSWRARHPRSPAAALPNPSLKASPNSVAHWPSSAGPAAHFALAVQRATLSGPP